MVPLPSKKDNWCFLSQRIGLRHLHTCCSSLPGILVPKYCQEWSLLEWSTRRSTESSIVPKHYWVWPQTNQTKPLFLRKWSESSQLVSLFQVTEKRTMRSDLEFTRGMRIHLLCPPKNDGGFDVPWPILSPTGYIKGLAKSHNKDSREQAHLDRDLGLDLLSLATSIHVPLWMMTILRGWNEDNGHISLNQRSGVGVSPDCAADFS